MADFPRDQWEDCEGEEGEQPAAHFCRRLTDAMTAAIEVGTCSELCARLRVHGWWGSVGVVAWA